MAYTLIRRDRYTLDRRLDDVVALIQATSKRRGEEAQNPDNAFWVTNRMMAEVGQPQSAESWSQVASEHPEFFVVQSDWITNIVRKFDPKHSSLEDKLILELIRTATDWYDREWQRKHDRSIKWPVWISAVGVLITLGTLLLNLLVQLKVVGG